MKKTYGDYLNKQGVPVHREFLLYGDRRENVKEQVPVGRVKGNFYCKYCHDRHSDWWLMNQLEFHLMENLNENGRCKDESDTILLCGKCEHTSRKGFCDN